MHLLWRERAKVSCILGAGTARTGAGRAVVGLLLCWLGECTGGRVGILPGLEELVRLHRLLHAIRHLLHLRLRRRRPLLFVSILRWLHHAGPVVVEGPTTGAAANERRSGVERRWHAAVICRTGRGGGWRARATAGHGLRRHAIAVRRAAILGLPPAHEKHDGADDQNDSSQSAYHAARNRASIHGASAICGWRGRGRGSRGGAGADGRSSARCGKRGDAAGHRRVEDASDTARGVAVQGRVAREDGVVVNVRLAERERALAAIKEPD